MKAFILLSLISLSCNAVTPTKKDAPKKQVVQKETKPLHPALKKVEDCDDKAKKPIEIKPETISLSGNTGCSLPE
ncbi:MAG: hypothetical protein ACJ76H_10945 [Bacteriovoracaceae bacterium]